MSFRAAVEAGDVEQGIATLHPDVTFRSPVVFKPYEGREVVGHILRAVFQTFEDFRYEAEVVDGSTTMLEFKARVGDKEVHGIDLLRHDEGGLVTDFTVMVRPMSGMLALAEAMRARLQPA